MMNPKSISPVYIVKLKKLLKNQEKLHIYFSKTSSLPSLINLYLTSILLLMPIKRPREIISKKSKAIVASSTVELLAYINPRRLGENKLPINNIDIMMRDAVPTT